MAAHVVRMLGCMVASIEGKLPEKMDDQMKLLRLREVAGFLDKAPWDLLSRDENYPTLGYIASFLLTTISQPGRNELRQEASKGLVTILRKHQNDGFTEKVAPGICSALFKFLTAWEREPLELVRNALECIQITLKRAWEYVSAAGKLEIVLDRIAMLGSAFRRSSELRPDFVRLVAALLTLGKAKTTVALQEGHIGRLVRALASVLAGVSQAQQVALTGDIDSCVYGDVALRMLEDNVEFLMHDCSSYKENAIEQKLEETAGLCSLLPSVLWPTDLAVKVLTIASRYFSTLTVASRQGCLTEAPSIIDLVWNTGTGQAVDHLLKATTTCVLPAILYLDCGFVVHHLLFSLSSVVAGVTDMSDEAAASIIDYLVEHFENPTDDPEANSRLEEGEFLLSFSWCCAVYALTIAAKESSLINDSFLFDYLLRPLLCHRASSKMQIKVFAMEILEELVRSLYPMESVKSLLLGRMAVLLAQIASDLRYPALYPQAPLVFSQLVTVILEDRAFSASYIDARSLVDIVKEMDDRAAELQIHPGYCLLLFNALDKSAMLARQGVTVLPTDPKLVSDDEPENNEPLNRPLTLEEELAEAIIRLAVHFITHDEERLRLAALYALSSAVSVFRPGKAAEPLYPLVHLTWRPLLARLSDGSLHVARQALQVISVQARLAGEFMRDRMQREMLPMIGGLLSREGETVGARTSIQVIVEMIGGMGQAGQQTVRGAVQSILEVCGRGVGVKEAVQMLLQVAQVDSDQVWYALVSCAPLLMGNGGRLSHHPTGSDGLVPDLTIPVLKVGRRDWTLEQLDAIKTTLAVLDRNE